MISSADLPETIPVFPLPGALLLPRSRLPLHIFEPRYLAMLEDALKTSHRLIGMVQPLPQSGRGGPKLHSIGCAGRVTAFSETDDGRYMITLSGVSRYRILSQVDGFSPYIRANVSWDGFARDLGPSEHDPAFDREDFTPLLSRYFRENNLSTDWDSLKQADDEMLIDALSMLCPFSVEDKQALLEAPTLSDRRQTLITLIEFALRGGNNEETMQ
ncbi:LON peptidase substrate-binding domain-containing protein [Actibacterium sp.]|uniref:LON peptidase substrate-binding domain-containing protein n=1 Tax=Actibacterium sp. TaxID=1872125 RepID=UPI0035620EB5